MNERITPTLRRQLAQNLENLRTVRGQLHRCELCWIWRVNLDGVDPVPAPRNGYDPVTQPYNHHPSCLAGRMGLF